MVRRRGLSWNVEDFKEVISRSADLMIEFLRQRVTDLSVPRYASCFEALGASLWALDNGDAAADPRAISIKRRESSFSRLSPLKDFRDQVVFRESLREAAVPGERCILGLDVGSTTTKAVLIRAEDGLDATPGAPRRTLGTQVPEPRTTTSITPQHLTQPTYFTKSRNYLCSFAFGRHFLSSSFAILQNCLT